MAPVTNKVPLIRLLENQISLVSFYLEPVGNNFAKTHFIEDLRQCKSMCY